MNRPVPRVAPHQHLTLGAAIEHAAGLDEKAADARNLPAERLTKGAALATAHPAQIEHAERALGCHRHRIAEAHGLIPGHLVRSAIRPTVQPLINQLCRVRLLGLRISE